MRNVSEKPQDTCCGCMACEKSCPVHCIAPFHDKEGFIYPDVDNSKCIACGKCLKVCPFENLSMHSRPTKAYASQYLSPTVWESASGGIAALLASMANANGNHVFGCAFTEDFSKAEHIEVKTDELCKLKGSKYVQSNLNSTFAHIKDFIEKGEKVLFFGTPCQVAGLKNFMGKNNKGLTTVDILCHGVASPLLFKQYIQNIVKRYGTVRSLNMRDKTFGWGHQSLKIIAKKPIPHNIQNFWHNLYFSRVGFRPSCYKCPYMDARRAGDISLGDFWGIKKVFPEFPSNAGVSLVLTNTDIGRQKFNEMEHLTHTVATDFKDSLQPVLDHFQDAPVWRGQFWHSIHSNGFVLTAYNYWGVCFRSSCYLKFKSFMHRIIRFIAFQK